MKDNKFTYEEMLVDTNDSEMYNLNKAIKQFELLEQGRVEEAIEYAHNYTDIRVSVLSDLAAQWYIMDESLEKVKLAIRYALKTNTLLYESVKKEHEQDQLDFIDTYKYVKYLRILSISYLLGYEEDEVKEFSKLIRLSNKDDILLDYILSAMIGGEVSTNVTLTNRYPKLAEIILEEDKEKAEDMMLDFLKNDWWKNSAKYPWRDQKMVDMYVGAFAYETAAVACIKGFDLTKFENVKYFPIDMAYYHEGISKTKRVMKDNRFTYDEMMEKINKNEEFNLNKAIKQFELLEQGKAEEAQEYAHNSNAVRVSALCIHAAQLYIMDESYEKIRVAIRYALKTNTLAYESLKKEHEQNQLDFIETYDYSDYLRILSMSYLLGYKEDEVKEFSKLIRLSNKDDILLDYILSAMIGGEISTNVTLTNRYPKLAEIILEEDKEKAEDMMLNFLKNDWWKNSAKYPWRDQKRSIFYVGAFAYETAAVACIKGFDLTKFEDVKYFPIDMAYYHEGVNKDIVVKSNEPQEKTITIEGVDYTFTTNDIDAKDFEYGEVNNIKFKDVTLEDISFNNTTIEHLYFENVTLKNVTFIGSNAFALQFQDCNIINCDFSESIHEGFLTVNCFVQGCVFNLTSMIDRTGMNYSIIDENTFINSSMQEFDFSNSIIRRNTFTDVILNDGDIFGSRFIDNEYENVTADYLNLKDVIEIDELKKYITIEK